MPVIVVIGGQWGDEGKGRMVDLLARNASVVVRYSAGNNAGHTVVTDQGIFRLHVVPAGIFYPDKVCLIGNGVVIDPQVLLEEIESLESQGVSTKNLFVSDRAHVIMPYHLLIDRLDEELRGPAAIGTTHRGVGPAFVDKVGRVGIRMTDLIRPEVFRERLSLILPYKNAFLSKLYGDRPLEFEEVFEPYSDYGRRLAPFVRDTMAMVQEALDRGETVLLEGAQGSLLDLDSGTYEYVTSSVPSSTAAGAAIGIGIGPTAVTKVVGVYKAYNTRVGNGPMPTELVDENGEVLPEGIQIRRPREGAGLRRVRRHHGSPAPLRLVRRRRLPLHGPPQRPERRPSHAARRAGLLQVPQDLHRLPDRRDSGAGLPGEHVGSCPLRAHLRRGAGVGAGYGRGPSLR